MGAELIDAIENAGLEPQMEALRDAAAGPQVRIIDVDDGTEDTCSLAEFLDANGDVFDEGSAERRALLAGDRVTIGGGAAPLVAVEVVR